MVQQRAAKRKNAAQV